MTNLATLTIQMRIEGKQVTRQVKVTRQEAEKLARAGDGASASIRTLDKSLGDANKTFTVSSGRLKVIGRDINRYVTLPFMAAAAASTKFALDINKGLGNVQALLPDTGDRIYALRDGIVDMAAVSGRSFQDLNDGLYRTISVFQDGEDTMDRLNTAVRAGIAGYASTADSVQLLASVTRAYGDTSAAAVAKVSDLAFETVRLGDTTFPALASAMQVATDRAVRLNVSQEELFATMATLTGITGDASMVATQFRSAMDSLLNPTKSMVGVLNTMGYETAQAAIESEGLVNVLLATVDAAERSGKPLQDFITRKEGITLVSRLAGEQLEDFTFRLNQMNGSMGAADKAYDSVTTGIGSYNFQLDKAVQQMKNAGAEIGQRFLPTLVSLAQATADLITSFTLLPEWIQNTVIATTGLVAVFGNLVLLLGVYQSLKIAGAFQAFGTIIQTVSTYTTALISKIAILNISLQTTQLIVGSLVGGFALLMGAYTAYNLLTMNAERARQEELEETNRLLNEQKSLISDASTLSTDLQNRVSSRRREIEAQYMESGRLPELGTRTRHVYEEDPAGGMRSIGSMTGLRIVNEGAYLISEMNEKAREEYTETARTILSEIRTVTDESQQLINSMTGAFQEGSDTIKSDMEEILEITSRMRVNPEVNAAGGFQSFTDMLENNDYDKMLGFLEEARDVAREGMQDHGLAAKLGRWYEAVQKMAAYDQNLVEGLQQTLNTQTVDDIAHLEAIIRTLMQSAGEIDDNVRPWQDWLESITGADFSVLHTATDVFPVLYEHMQELTEFEMDMASILGIDRNRSEIIRNNLSMIEDAMREVFEIDPSEINWAFESLGDPRMQGMAEAYRHEVSNLASALTDELRLSWQMNREEMEQYNDVMQRNSVETKKLHRTQDYWLSEIQNIQSIMQELRQETGANEEQLRRLNEQMDAAAQYARVAGMEIKTASERFDEMGLSVGPVGDMLGSVFIEGGTREAREELRALQEEFALMEENFYTTPATLEATADRIEELTSSINNFGTVGLFGLAMGLELLTAVSSEINDVFYEMGYNLKESGNALDDMSNSVMNLAGAILYAIPSLMIQAGSALIQGGELVIGTSLLLGGLALQAGIALGEGTADSIDNKGNRLDQDRMASGGILNGPTSYRGATIGESGPEAVLPLVRNQSGDLGVQTAGGESAPVIVNIINQTGVDVETEERRDDDGNIQIIMKKAFRNMVASGVADKEFNARYNVRTARR